MNIPKKTVRPFRAEKVIPPRNRQEVGDLAESYAGLDLEIGCGVGYHPIQYALKNPDRFLVAIEHTAIKFEKFKRRLKHHPQIKNVHAVHANAIAWIAHELSEETVDRIFLLYPNPNHLWYQLPFMHQLVKVMNVGGVLELRTNLQEYQAEAKIYLSEAFGLLLDDEAELKFSPDYRPATHFEKKYLERGETCFLQRWKKV